MADTHSPRPVEPAPASAQPAVCVGRDTELDRLRALHDRARRERAGQVALLVGAPGTGKTRLAGELARRMRAAGVPVLEGACRPADASVSYQPFVDIMQAALAHLVEHGATGDRVARAAEVAATLRGQSGTRRASTGAKLALVRDLPDGRLAFFDRVRQVLAAAGSPVVIVHDIHLADPTTASLLAYLARTLAPAPGLAGGEDFNGLLVATTLDGDAPAWLDQVSATVVHVGGLDLDGVRALLATPQFAERFLAATGGIPRRIEALAAGLAAGLADGDGHVDHALATLSPAAARLCRALAVYGRPAGAALLERLNAALEGDDASRSHPVSDLRDFPLLQRSVAGGELRLGFAHAGERAAVVRAIAPGELTILHRAIGEVLVKDVETLEDPAACAEHLLRGEAGEAGVDMALATGEGLERAFAYERAIALYLAARAATARGDVVATLDERLADLYQVAGDYARALDVVRRLADRNPGDAATAGRLGHLHLLRGDFAVARVELERARDLAHAAGEIPLIVQALADLAEAFLQQGQHDEALAAGAAAIARAGRDPFCARGRIAARNSLGKVHLERGEYDLAFALFADNRAEAAATGLPFEISRALINLGIAALRQGDHAAAEAHYQAGLAAADEHGDARHRAFCQQNLGVLKQWRRDYTAALGHYQEAVAAFKRLGHRPWLAWVAIDLGDLYLGLGDIDRAQAMADLAARLTIDVPTAAVILDNLRGRIFLERGDCTKARVLLDGALDTAARIGNRDELSLTLLNLARLDLAEEDPRASLRRLDEIAAGSSARVAAQVLAARGEAQLALRAHAEARTALEAAAAAFAALDDDEGRLRALLLASAAAEAEGDTRFVRQALKIARELDAGLRRRVPAEHAATYGQEPARRALRTEVAARPAAPLSAPPPTQPIGRPLTKIIGRSPQVAHVLEMVERVAPHDTLVLIRGESGTGKELVAEAIHERSPRRTRPFVKVNCGALVDTLLLSELFGHERGAFTGAQSRRKGRFELADGGTLFLDEIGDISPQTQVALLRVLQTHEFERVGGTQSVRVDVRIVCATNRDLENMVQTGRFREDLYYRLKGVEIDLPPLRARGADIAELVRHFLTQIADERSTLPKRMRPSAVEALTRHPWPGNVRELENVIRSVTLFADGDEIDAADLTDYLGTPVAVLPTPEPAAPRGAAAPASQAYDEIARGVPLRELKRRIELDCITRALNEAGGNITRAAERLGMKRPRLSQLLKEHGIARSLSEEKS